MTHHIVLMRLKQGVARDDARLREVLADLAALREQIEGIVRWDYGWDFLGRPISYDFALVSTFVSRAAFEAYLAHPVHQAVAGRLRELVDWVLCDFEA